MKKKVSKETETVPEKKEIVFEEDKKKEEEKNIAKEDRKKLLMSAKQKSKLNVAKPEDLVDCFFNVK